MTEKKTCMLLALQYAYLLAQWLNEADYVKLPERTFPKLEHNEWFKHILYDRTHGRQYGMHQMARILQARNQISLDSIRQYCPQMHSDIVTLGPWRINFWLHHADHSDDGSEYVEPEYKTDGPSDPIRDVW